MRVANDRYKQVYLSDNVLNDTILQQMLCEGQYNSSEIGQSLSHSEYFTGPDEEPAWQTVWHGKSRKTEEFENALQTLEKKFSKREFVKSGEILHVIGLRLWCAKIGQPGFTTKKVISSCKQYIDDLLENEKLLDGFEPTVLKYADTGAYGLGFYQIDTEEFQELAKYYSDRCNQAQTRKFPDQAANLLTLMKSDADQFFEQVCWTNDDRENKFANLPILSGCDPEEFVDCFLECHPAEQRKIFLALEGRYQGAKLIHQLADEQDWVKDVVQEFIKRAAELSPIGRHVIESDVNRVLTPLLN